MESFIEYTLEDLELEHLPAIYGAELVLHVDIDPGDPG